MKELDKKEKRIFLTSGVALFLIICFAVLFFSSLVGIKKYSRQILLKKSEYKQMLKLSSQFQQIKGQKITSLNSPPLTYLENKIKLLNLGENLVSIRPLSENENEIEAKFENLSGNQITKLLYEIQKLPFAEKQISLKDYENDNLWTLKIIVSEIK